MSASIPPSHEALFMQAASSAPQVATDRSPHPESPAQLGVDAGSRLYELWNAIFARAGVSADEQSSPATSRPSATSLAHDTGRSSNPEQASGQPSFAPGTPVLQPKPPHPTRDDGTDLTIVPVQSLVVEAHPSGPTGQVVSAARNAVSREPVASTDPDVREPAPAQAVSSLPKEQLTTSQSSGVSDSVSVFLHGAVVSIVARDATISPREAVDCAFETARQITGQRSALLRLTLNGRTLYWQQTAAYQMQPALLFAC